MLSFPSNLFLFLLQAKNKLKTKKLKSAKLDSIGTYLADLDSVLDDELVLVSTNPPTKVEAADAADASPGEVNFSAEGTERKSKDVGGKLFDQVGAWARGRVYVCMCMCCVRGVHARICCVTGLFCGCVLNAAGTVCV